MIDCSLCLHRSSSDRWQASKLKASREKYTHRIWTITGNLNEIKEKNTKTYDACILIICCMWLPTNRRAPHHCSVLAPNKNHASNPNKTHAHTYSTVRIPNYSHSHRREGFNNSEGIYRNLEGQVYSRQVKTMGKWQQKRILAAVDEKRNMRQETRPCQLSLHHMVTWL